MNFHFGTEEYVAIRRQLVRLREKLMTHNFKSHTICSGSLGEGVAYPTSDDDRMHCFPGLRLEQTYREATQRGAALIVPSEFSPGYCLLMVITDSFPVGVLHIINEMPVMSSTLWKQYCISHVEGTSIIHGPCLSNTDYNSEFDLAFGIPSSFWPEIAQEWPIRNRSYGWPSDDIIQTIVTNGCHVVPIGDPESPFGLHEWRISFSVAERTLMHSFNHAQFLTYNILRLTLKGVIDKEAPGVFCSYFMKTALFYAIENTYAHVWHVGNLETCFRRSLAVLCDFVNYMNCPSYFIQEYNMIRRKINSGNQLALSQILKSIYRIGIFGVFYLSGHKTCSCGSLSFHAPRLEIALDREFLSSYLFKCTKKHLSISFSELLSFESCLPKLFELIDVFKYNLDEVLIEMFIHRAVINCSERMMDILGTIRKENKQNYHRHKTVECLLRVGYRGDVTSGKLAAATYFYMVGKTELALSVIRQMLSEYPPYALDSTPNGIKESAYMDVMCCKAYSIKVKAKHAWVQSYTLCDFCLNAWPLPLRIIIYTFRAVSLFPTSYAFFLESLCYLRLQESFSLQRSTRCLINDMKDTSDPFDFMLTKLCVGIIKYANGDNQSALRWFGSAYMMKGGRLSSLGDQISKLVVTYIACILKTHFS
ncbi:hypothetical protein FSP39_019785 [Pinctada imbricata]|uniref:Mab-21-like HhH/H2TH-like domain-containing protein n=1 Tax=Pinctada imbricata TaxID=66713 RepID=A0AA89BX06_PINIB|nr:hypothetical protein FSP39_019785 [Pinctada imbricata]